MPDQDRHMAQGRPRQGNRPRFNAFPCTPSAILSADGYGCSRVVKEFGIEPIDKTVTQIQKGRNNGI